MKKFAVLLIFLCFFGLNAYSETVNVKKDPKLITISKTKQINKEAFKKELENNNKTYKKEEKNLGDAYYNLYRITDRIIRANNLNTQNWRFAIKNKSEDINAYATAVNLVTIHSSLFDSLYNNDDALAFVIGHEIGHFLYNHNQKSLELNKKAEDNMYYYGASIGSIVGIPLSPIFGMKVRYAYRDIRQMEYDADNEALTLMIRAGYSPEGAIEAMEYIAQIPHKKKKQVDDTHPLPEERLKAIQQEIERLNIDELKHQGENNLLNSEVLAVKKASDKKSIVIMAPENKAIVRYTPETTDKKSLKKAYRAYLKNDMKVSKQYFEEAYKLNKKNYIAPLYLSYINEYEYNETGSKDSLKKANYWIKKAQRINSTEKNIIKQKTDIENLVKASK